MQWGADMATLYNVIYRCMNCDTMFTSIPAYADSDISALDGLPLFKRHEACTIKGAVGMPALVLEVSRG
jgi:hypothetical protein